MPAMKRNAPSAEPAPDWDAAGVRARLNELAQRDPEFTRFGSDGHYSSISAPTDRFRAAVTTRAAAAASCTATPTDL